MKLYCMICKHERELSQDEIMEIGEWVAKKNLQTVDYLERIGLEDGYTCGKGDVKKKHDYEFSEDWDKEIHQLANGIKISEEERDILDRKIEELDNKIKELTLEKEGDEKKYFELDGKVGKLEDKIKEMTGTNNWKLWI